MKSALVALALTVATLANAATVEYFFDADVYPFMFQGKMINAVAINGTFGEAIHVSKGDRLIVHLSPSSAVSGISIHWHGFHMKNRQAYDGVVGVTMCPVRSWSTFVYNFTVDEIPGTYWWHTHSHHTMSNWHDLVMGPLIVHDGPVPASAEASPFAYDNDRIIFFQDMFKDNPQGRMLSSVGNMHQTISRGIKGDIVGTLPWWGGLFNYGESEKNETFISVTAGQKYYFRVMSGNGLFGLNFSIPGLKLKIVATDGAPLPKSISVDLLFIYPAERYDVEVEIPSNWNGRTISVLARTLENQDQGYDHQINGFLRIGSSAPWRSTGYIALPAEPIAFNCYKGQLSRGTCLTFASIVGDKPDEPVVPPDEHDYSPENTVTHEVDFYFNAPPQFAHFVRIDGGHFYQHVNSHYPMIGNTYPYQLHNHTVTLDLKLGTTAIIILRTNARMHHPMHFHGMKFEVLEQYTIDQDTDCHITSCDWTEIYKSPEKLNQLKNMPYTGVLKDTVVMPTGGVAVIRFPVDNPGAWLAHCHISLHMDDGMTLVLRQGSVEQARDIITPEDWPECEDESAMITEPYCECYYDVDDLRFGQLDENYYCSRTYLCLHDTQFFPQTNFEPTLNQGISMHRLSPDTVIVLPIVFCFMLLVVSTFYTYSKMFGKKPSSYAEVAVGNQFYSSFKEEFLSEWERSYRDAINPMRVVEVSGLAILTGIVFWQVGDETSHRALRESVSLLFFSTTLWTFTRMYPSIPAHNMWYKRMRDRIHIPEDVSQPIITPPFLDAVRLTLARVLVYFCAESWWPILFGLLVYPIAHINGKVSIWFQHIALLMLNNMCYVSFGSFIGTTSDQVPVGMISSTLYSQTSLVCAGFYRTLPSWLSWFRYVSFVYYTFSGLVKGAFMWQDSYSCNKGDSRFGQEWCPLEFAGIIEDMKLRGISVANSSDPLTNDVSFDFGMLILFYFINVTALCLMFYVRIYKKCNAMRASRDTPSHPIVDSYSSVEMSMTPVLAGTQSSSGQSMSPKVKSPGKKISSAKL